MDKVSNARHIPAIKTAVGMALAGNLRDIEAVLKIWDSQTPAEMVDTICALAQLPSWIIDQLGGNATTFLTETAEKLTETD